MDSMSDTQTRFNDEPGSRLEAQTAPPAPPLAVTQIAKPPPIAADFTHVTTRFMIGGRQWVRDNREAAWAAFKSAVLPWDDKLQLTIWEWSGYPPATGTAARPGTGKDRTFTIKIYGEMLRNHSRKTLEKGKAGCTTLGVSKYRGRSDDECQGRSGLFLDSDNCGGWDTLRALLRSVELAFVGQMRPVKPDSCHLEIPYAKPWVPERDAVGSTKPWKDAVYRPQLGYMLGILSELGSLRFEPAWDAHGHASAKYAGADPMCDQLLQANYVYTCRPDDPEDHFPVTDYATGGALDVDALLKATGFEDARARLARAAGNTHRRVQPVSPVSPTSLARPTSPASPVAGVPGLRRPAGGIEERISMVALGVRLRRLANPESRKLVEPLLGGRSYAPLGQRNTTMWRIACIVAAVAPNEAPASLAEVFRTSLTAMAKEPGAQPAVGYVGDKLALVAEMIGRAQRGAHP